MKFGDKLIELRKRNGYSQEELAEKLGVSRQSVSKWESNNTYPETDKIIQIANLFDCSMDDLINDKITDIESSLRKNKNNLYNVWDSLLEFITNTVNMFSKMKFIDGLKCVIEIIILSLILKLIGSIICGSISTILSNILSFLGTNITHNIKNILNGIFELVWFVIAIITIIYAFKIRYLDYYKKDNKEKVKEDNNQNNKTALKENTKENNNIREEKPFEFLSFLSKIVIIFIKFIAFNILIGTVFTSIGLITSSALTLYHIPIHIIFLWISLLLISGSIVTIQIIIILISFIFNKKIDIKKHIIIFISCVIISGISLGLTALTAKNIDYITDGKIFKNETKTVAIKYKDNLVIENHNSNQSKNYKYNYKYIIDNNMSENEITASRQIDPRFFKLIVTENEMDKMPVVKVNEIDNGNAKAYYNFLINSLKKNKIYTFGNYGKDPLIITANEETINKLLENQKKLYLIEENRNNNEINVIIHDDKVFFPNGLNGEYNGLDDTIKYYEDNYICKKEIVKTEYGERIIYNCNYNEE